MLTREESFYTTHIMWTSSIHEVLHQTKVAVIVVLAFLMMSLLPLIGFVKAVKPKWSDLTSFVFICALPFIWFAALRNHTILHGFFVSAILYISFAMVLSLMLMKLAERNLVFLERIPVRLLHNLHNLGC